MVVRTFLCIIPIRLYTIHMNTLSTANSSLSPVQTAIPEKYNQWISFYNTYCADINKHYRKWTKNKQNHEATRNIAIEAFEAILREVGSTQDQIMKIDASLRLIELSPKCSEAAARYLYTAVELAQLHIWALWYTHNVGKVLFEIYETHIASKESIVEFGSTPLKIRNKVLLMRIGEETNRRKQKRMEIWTAPIQDKNTPLTAEENIERLELLFGPVRLAIIAEGDTIITSHRITEGEALTLSSFLASHTIQVHLFGRVRTYRFFIDHGSKTGRHAFESDESMRKVHSLIGAHISAREELSGIEATEHDRQFREYTRTPSPPNHDYRHFIVEVLRHQTMNRKLHIHSTSEEYLQAIAICWAITSHHTEKSTSTEEDLSQKIDTILWGRISRVVYDMVTSMLLAQHETMHGTGYPYGLMRWEIPLEGKLYRVICAYRTLCWQNPRNQEQIILGLRKWSRGGNLDPDIVDIFIDNIASIGVLEPPWETAPITPYRIERLMPYQKRWRELVGLMDDLRWRYDILRTIERDDQAKRKDSLKIIDDTTQRIRAIAALKVHLIISRHQLAQSDMPGWPPGNDNEGLAPQGFTDAKGIWAYLRGLDFMLHTSPLLRSYQTAETLCKEAYQCLADCICRRIYVEQVLTNISKDQENLLPATLLGKLAQVEFKWLMEFIVRIISSSWKSTHLIITHADILRIVQFIIENLFSLDGFSATKRPVEHKVLIEYLFRGNSIVDWDLIFSTGSWSNRLNRLTSLTGEIFGTAFQPPQTNEISLTHLHKRFCDYLDEMFEKFPQKRALFLDTLGNDFPTEALPELLRKEKFGKWVNP